MQCSLSVVASTSSLLSPMRMAEKTSNSTFPTFLRLSASAVPGSMAVRSAAANRTETALFACLIRITLSFPEFDIYFFHYSRYFRKILYK